MKVCIHQPQFWPWPGYFSKIINSDIFIIHQHVQYQKNSIINRNTIKGANSTLILTIPVKKGSLNTEIYEKEINNYEWIEKQIIQIKTSYAKSKMFPVIMKLIQREYENYCKMSFIDILKQNIKFVLSYLDINVIVRESKPDNLRGSELILNMVKFNKGKQYVTGTGAYNYLDFNLFKSENIKVIIGTYKEQPYNQVRFKNMAHFVSGLSILDMIFNIERNEINQLLKDNWVVLSEI